MGIAVWTSMVGRAPAAGLVAGAVDDDTRQDESHARDADQVRRVLRDEAGVRVVVDRAEVDHDVQDTAHGHQRDAEDHRERELADPFYHEHPLSIHLTRRHVKSIARIRM
jgi:hypothetical protein